MKKYLFLSLLFLLTSSPVIAKGQPESQNQPSGKHNIISTQNQGKEDQLNVKTQENEPSDQEVSQSFTKVSDQVKQLIETTGAKGGIGQQVKIIAQNQEKTQNQIKSDFAGLNSRGALIKLFFGSDQKLIKSLDQKLEQNHLTIQQLEQLKLGTKNENDLQQLQETINSITSQNNLLQTNIAKENSVRGMFGWLTNFFNQQ